MADVTNEIRIAFESAIARMAKAKALKVGYENIPFTPPTGVFLTCHLLIADNSGGTLCAEKKNGIFQVTVISPLSEGTDKTDALAAEIINLFPRGSMCGIAAIPKEPNRSKGYVVDDRYCVAVSVNYFV